MQPGFKDRTPPHSKDGTFRAPCWRIVENKPSTSYGPTVVSVEGCWPRPRHARLSERYRLGGYGTTATLDRELWVKAWPCNTPGGYTLTRGARVEVGLAVLEAVASVAGICEEESSGSAVPVEPRRYHWRPGRRAAASS